METAVWHHQILKIDHSRNPREIVVVANFDVTDMASNRLAYSYLDSHRSQASPHIEFMMQSISNTRKIEVGTKLLNELTQSVVRE